MVLNVMFMGGAVPKGVDGAVEEGDKMDVDIPVPEGESKENTEEKKQEERSKKAEVEQAEILSTTEFWEDLKGWVGKRVAGQGTPVDVDAVVSLWKEAWEGKKSAA